MFAFPLMVTGSVLLYYVFFAHGSNKKRVHSFDFCVPERECKASTTLKHLSNPPVTCPLSSYL